MCTPVQWYHGSATKANYKEVCKQLTDAREALEPAVNDWEKNEASKPKFKLKVQLYITAHYLAHAREKV